MTSERSELEALAIERTHCKCHPETCCCGDYTLRIDGEEVITGSKVQLEAIVSVARRLQPGNAEAAYRLLQDVRDHCIRVEGMWPDLDTRERLQQMHVELQDRVRSTVAAKGGLQPARVPTHRVADLLHLLQYATITTPTIGDAEQAQKVMAELRGLLAAAPAPEALREWSERMAAVEIGQHVSAGSHGIADEPAPEAETPVPACGGDLMRCTEHSGACAVCKPEGDHSCRSCLGIDPASCMFNPAPEAAPQTHGEAVDEEPGCDDCDGYEGFGGHCLMCGRDLGPANPAPAADALVFADTAPEAGFIEDAQRLNCPACGGSGHVGDVITSGDGGVEELAVLIADELARIDGYDPEDPHGGLYDLRWSGGPEPEPAGDAWTMDYLPKAERIARSLTSAKQQCCMCGRRFDSRERIDGGGPDGAQLADGRWACSESCWERASAQQAGAIRLPQADCGGEGE